jgi:RNA polymerase sigma-70 factor (ECF subfamily)
LGGEPQPLDEQAVRRLVEEARAGDPEARRELYTQYVSRVFRTVRAMLQSDADAEDVTQDAMLTVLTSLRTYNARKDTRFVAWVTTIAVNTVRRRFRRRRPQLTATGELPDLPAEIGEPGEDLDRARERRALLIALAELDDRDRLILSLRYGAELDATEIGSSVDLEPAAVRKILERARARLGERIGTLLKANGGVDERRSSQ